LNTFLADWQLQAIPHKAAGKFTEFNSFKAIIAEGVGGHYELVWYLPCISFSLGQGQMLFEHRSLQLVLNKCRGAPREYLKGDRVGVRHGMGAGLGCGAVVVSGCCGLGRARQVWPSLFLPKEGVGTSSKGGESPGAETRLGAQ
jgi:hypothetical protein